MYEYINSLIRYANKKYFKINGESTLIFLYLIDKRYLKTNNLGILKFYFPKCKIKDLDDYWYLVYSSNYLNTSEIFLNMLNNKIIVSISEFYRI